MNADEWKSADYTSKARPPLKDADHIVVIDLASHIGREKITQCQRKSRKISCQAQFLHVGMPTRLLRHASLSQVRGSFIRNGVRVGRSMKAETSRRINVSSQEGQRFHVVTTCAYSLKHIITVA